jgi:cell division ATPase FtsA
MPFWSQPSGRWGDHCRHWRRHDRYCSLYRGNVWHTAVIPVGGYHITNDVAIGLRAPYDVAEMVKIRYGDCRPDQIDPAILFTVEPFGGEKIQVSRQDLAHVIEARVEEIFNWCCKRLSAPATMDCCRPVLC